MRSKHPWNTLKYDVMHIRRRLKIVDNELDKFETHYMNNMTPEYRFALRWMMGAIRSIDDQIKSLRCHACDTRICKHKFKDKKQPDPQDAA